MVFTGEAVLIANSNKYGQNEGAPRGCDGDDTHLYVIGNSGASDNLYWLHNVQWDADIDPIEVDEGEDTSLDLSGVSQDATSFEFAPSHTTRSWLTLSGTTLSITNAPAVAADTDFQAVVRAVRSSVNEDKTLTITVRDTTPKVPSAPRNVKATDTGSNFIELGWDAPADDGRAAIQDYEVRHAEGQTAGGTWTSIGSATRSVRIGSLKKATQYTFQVRAVNSVGGGPASASVRKTTDVTPPRPVSTQPSAPGQVEIQMTPRTAEVSWKAPTNGAVIDEYEMSAEEGSTPGTEWVATGSTQTRTMVKGLKRSTAYTFSVRGRNAQGAGLESAAMTQTTPIASLHNALFFKECVNYLDDGERVSVHGDPTDIVRAAADNDYNTFTTEKDLDINIAVNGDPTRVDAIFVKGIDIEAHSAVPTGGSGSGYSNRQMPDTVENWEGTEISTLVNGFQHDLYLLGDHFTATSVRMTFTGASAKIYEIMLLEFLFEIDANSDFTKIAPDYVDRSAVIHTSPDGGVRRSSPLGGERHKWETDYVVKIIPGKTQLESVDEFVTQMAENPNVVHAQEPSRYPARIHPASFLLTRVLTRLRGDNKLLGDLIRFQVGEQ